MEKADAVNPINTERRLRSGTAAAPAIGATLAFGMARRR
jgi:hypothetical protein